MIVIILSQNVSPFWLGTSPTDFEKLLSLLTYSLIPCLLQWLQYLVIFFRRVRDRSFDNFAFVSQIPTRCVIQEDINELNTGPMFDQTFFVRHGVTVCMWSLSLTALGLPQSNFIALLGFSASYWTVKYMLINLYRKPYSLNLDYDLVLVLSSLAYPATKIIMNLTQEKTDTMSIIDTSVSIAMAFLAVATIIILNSISKKEHSGSIKFLLNNVELDQLVMMYNNKN